MVLQKPQNYDASPLCSTPSGALLLPWLARPREAGGGAAWRRLMLPTHSERAPRSPMTSCTSHLCPWKFDRATVQQLLQLSIKRVLLCAPVRMQRLCNSSISFHTCAAVSEIALSTSDLEHVSFQMPKSYFTSQLIGFLKQLDYTKITTLHLDMWLMQCIPFVCLCL